MRIRRSVSGFTLIELAISVAIASVAIIAAVVLLAISAKRAGAFAEATELDDRRAVLGDLLRQDFDLAGAQISLSRPFSGGQIAPTLISDSAYQITSDGTSVTITKSASGDWRNYPVLSGRIAAGPISVIFRPSQNSVLGFYGETLANNAYLAIGESANGTIPVQIYANDGSLSASLSPHTAGDLYRIAIEGDASGASRQVLRYYRARSGIESLIYQTTSGIPSFPLGIFAGVQYAQGSPAPSIKDIMITAGVMATASQTSLVWPQMPYDSTTNSRLTGPITISGNEVTIVSGKIDTDPVFTAASFTGAGTSLHVSYPTRGAYRVGDYILVSDRTPGQEVSSLYRVTGGYASSQAVFTLTVQALDGSTSDLKAWGHYYSNTSDRGHTFPPGSLVAQLRSVLTWSLSSDGRLIRTEMYREVSGSSVKEGIRAPTAALGVTSFTVTPIAGTASTSYNISVGVTGEGFAASGTNDEFTYTVLPRAAAGSRDYLKILNP